MLLLAMYRNPKVPGHAGYAPASASQSLPAKNPLVGFHCGSLTRIHRGIARAEEAEAGATVLADVKFYWPATSKQ